MQGRFNPLKKKQEKMQLLSELTIFKPCFWLEFKRDVIVRDFSRLETKKKCFYERDK